MQGLKIWQKLVWIYISSDSEASVHADSNILRSGSTKPSTYCNHLSHSSLLSPPIFYNVPTTTPLSVCSSDITIWFKGHLPLGPHFLFRWRVKGLRRAGAVKDQLLPSSSHSQPLEDSLIVDRERKWHHPTPIWEVYCFNWLCLVQHTHSICTDLTA